MTAVATLIKLETITGYRDGLSARRDRVQFVDLPWTRQLAVDGIGEPGGRAFQEAFRALYPVAYTLHFALKRHGIDAPIGALEGLFWVPGAEDAGGWSLLGDRDPGGPLSWSLRLPVADAATESEIEAAIATVREKQAPPALDRLRVVEWTEGPAAQILHVGPYDVEGPTIRRLHAAIADAGARQRGIHHEIYISDPTRTAPERLKTVIRQPIELDA